MNIKPSLPILVAVLVLVGAAFFGGLAYGRSQVPSLYLIDGLANKTLGQPPEVDFSLFWDAWRLLEQKYAERGALDRQQMVYGAIEGMVKSLGDPYTVFLPPEETKMFREDVSGSFEGIGAEIGLRDEVLTIIAPLEDSPAQEAGVRAGDKIIRIDDTSTEGLSLNEGVQRIRGPRGTEVRLTLLREGSEELIEVSITRDTIRVPIVEWERIDNTAHVRLFSFSENAPQLFRQAALEVTGSGVDRIVLDLRNNPGGYLEVSQQIAGWFVEPGRVVATEDFGDERQDKEYRAVGNGALKDYELVVLINEGSASAAEILAGALRDIRGVQLIGAKSFGKGSVQELEGLSGGASLKVTVARWLTPSGKSISQEGLEPNIAVERTNEDIEADRDPQLDRALEVVKNL
jgi:carboxyl-terminal processing protease